MRGAPVKGDHRSIGTTLLAAAFLFAACGQADLDEHVVDEPAAVESIEGTDLARIEVTEAAAARLDIQTTPVWASDGWMVVPSAAVFVDPDGDFWVYSSPEPLTFVRREIQLHHEESGQAFLSNGPPSGTEVVTVGVAELYGTEFGVGH